MTNYLALESLEQHDDGEMLSFLVFFWVNYPYNIVLLKGVFLRLACQNFVLSAVVNAQYHMKSFVFLFALFVLCFRGNL